MNPDAHASVTQWINDLKRGDDGAAEKLWERYFNQLAEVARNRLASVPKRAFDEEDIAASAFHSLYRGATEGRLGEMRDRTDLWKVLVTIAHQKVVDRIRYETADKRGKGLTRGESAFFAPDRPDAAAGINSILDREPTPEFLAALEEQNQRLFDMLRDDSLRQVALLRLDGHANAEIAGQLDITIRSVERKLGLIRETWERELNVD